MVRFEHPELMPQRVATWARQNPNGAALRHVDGSVLSWQQAHQDSLRWASALERVGVKSGEPVVTVFVNTFEAFTAWMGCAWLGAIESPINTNYKGDWLRHVIERIPAPALLLADQIGSWEPLFDVADQLIEIETSRRVRRQVRLARGISCRRGCRSDVISAKRSSSPTPNPCRATPNRRPWDTSALIYTSGTTGRSKAVMVPWGHFEVLARKWLHPCSKRMQDNLRIYAPFPVFHVTGKGGFYYNGSSRGSRGVIREAFSVTDYWDDIRTYGANGDRAARAARSDADEPTRAARRCRQPHCGRWRWSP